LIGAVSVGVEQVVDVDEFQPVAQFCPAASSGLMKLSSARVT
jgi:hypothetical protein